MPNQTTLRRVIMTGSIDPDAAAYISAITAVGATPSSLQSQSINTFYKLEKSSGRFNSISRLYLPVWNIAAANAIDLKTRQSATFVGSPIFAIGYVQGDGTNASYLRDTLTLTEMGLTSTSMTIGTIVVQAPTATADWLGVRDGAGDVLISSSTASLGSLLGGTGPNNGSYASSEQTGIFYASRTGSNSFFRRRRTAGVTSVATSSSAAAAAPPSGVNARAAYMLRWNSAINTPQTGNNARYGAFFFGTSLSSDQLDEFSLNLKNLWETTSGLTLP